MNNRCAIFLDADPLSKKEIQAVRQVEKIYGHVDIFIERKYQTRKSLLSYDDKVDIIKHEVKLARCSYQMHPIDISKYDSLQKTGICNIAMILSAGSDMKKLNEQMSMYFQLIEDCSVIFIPVKQKNDVDPKFIWQLMIEDASKEVCKKFISDYAYFKVKNRLTKKIAIECPAMFHDAVMSVLNDREDQFYSCIMNSIDESQICNRLSLAIMKTQLRCIMICTADASSLKPYVDCVVKFGKCKDSLYIDGNDDTAVRRSMINLLNGKLKQQRCIEIF